MILEQFFFRRLVLDEFHECQELKRREGQILLAIKSHYRWGLTGTPRTDTVQDVAYLASAFGLDLILQPSAERKFCNAVYASRGSMATDDDLFYSDGGERHGFYKYGRRREIDSYNFVSSVETTAAAPATLVAENKENTTKTDNNKSAKSNSNASSSDIKDKTSTAKKNEDDEDSTSAEDDADPDLYSTTQWYVGLQLKHGLREPEQFSDYQIKGINKSLLANTRKILKVSGNQDTGQKLPIGGKSRKLLQRFRVVCNSKKLLLSPKRKNDQNVSFKAEVDLEATRDMELNYGDYFHVDSGRVDCFLLSRAKDVPGKDYTLFSTAWRVAGGQYKPNWEDRWQCHWFQMKADGDNPIEKKADRIALLNPNRGEWTCNFCGCKAPLENDQSSSLFGQHHGSSISGRSSSSSSSLISGTSRRAASHVAQEQLQPHSPDDILPMDIDLVDNTSTTSNTNVNRLKPLDLDILPPDADFENYDDICHAMLKKYAFTCMQCGEDNHTPDLFHPVTVAVEDEEDASASTKSSLKVASVEHQLLYQQLFFSGPSSSDESSDPVERSNSKKTTADHH